ncbi:peroxiredoxin [Planomicrobium soli]|uniref:Peroxiredoxin n=1 Tax=Planomicrobium soli TaxID=1176648 RepID=A0A2P8G359_9BACL|nr:redoxin domain-containing protein [Planomicrobium soli]PSL28366.1 peroxiredoxin [Planomicrobium soli]
MPKRIIGLLLMAVMIGIVISGIVKNNIEQNESLETMSVGTDVEFLATKEGLAPGEVAPDFELTTLSGEAVKLSDYKGKKVILNFWATWCPPCKAEMPLMQNYYDDAKEENVEILAVNLTTEDRGIDKITEFVRAHNLTFPVPMDKEGDIGSIYQAITIPTSYMIDTEGRVQKKHIGPMDEKVMKDYIANLQ